MLVMSLRDSFFVVVGCQIWLQQPIVLSDRDMIDAGIMDVLAKTRKANQARNVCDRFTLFEALVATEKTVHIYK